MTYLDARSVTLAPPGRRPFTVLAALDLHLTATPHDHTINSVTDAAGARVGWKSVQTMIRQLRKNVRTFTEDDVLYVRWI